MQRGIHAFRWPLVIFLVLALFFAVGCSSGGRQRGGEKEPIKVGVLLPLSGPAGTSGTRVLQGVQLAAKEINEAGGLLGGRQIAVIPEDHKANSAEAVSGTEKLVSRDNVVAIIGAYHTACTLAMMPITEKAGVPQIEPVATAAVVTQKGHPSLFRISSTNEFDAEYVCEPMVKRYGFTKVAFMADDTDWGKSVLKGYSEAMKKAGAEVVAEVHIPKGTTDFMVQLTKVKASGANSVVMTTDIESLSILIKQAMELGMRDIKKLSTSGNPQDLILKLAGREAAEGVYAVEYYAPPWYEGAATPENTKFAEAYETAYAAKADYFTAEGYISMKILADAITRANSAERAEVVKALRDTRLETLRGQCTFDQTGQGRLDVFVSQIQNGKPVKVDLGR